MNTPSAKYEATRVTLIGMCLDLILGFGKIAGGMYTQSFALVTDGIHSLTDAVTDVFVLIVARISHSAPDEEHQYGHGRFETIGTIAMGIVFFTTAGIILFDSVNRLRESDFSPVPAIAGAAIAAISIASKEWIYHYTMRVANRLNSNLLKANAWHSRSDAFSSVAVLIGILAAQQGYVWMDIVAAMFVALIIAKIGWELCVDSLKELVDTAVPKQRRAQFVSCILAVEGILEVTSLRSRLSGGKIILEVRLLVNPRISVSEGHQLGETVSKSLTGQFADISEVLAHIDPVTHDDNNATQANLSELPQRAEIIERVKHNWRALLDDNDIESIDLHYLGSGIEIDLTLNRDTVSPQLASDLESSLHTIRCITCLRIFHKLYESNPTQTPT
ncbi:MAG: cation-efflux pump [SAR86 cluster bacterium]|uniref:Cation-efflux pump n=1 Tax=SAR86 cluster bacterium TaxID=2030880 RepID=A0A2A5BAH2_9GAMM|nr:MAG: cation-efflux pump [SAR86 cluster bacterium]